MSHSIHAILVNIPYAAESANKNLSKMTKEEMIIDYATNETKRFCGPVFDYRELLDDKPVLFANENWDAFEEILLAIDNDQKNRAKFMLRYLKSEAESTDVSEILSTLLLANNRIASHESVDHDAWEYDYLNQGAWALREIARLIHGDYTIDSCFYDTSRDTALVPFIAKLKENPTDWALVQFDYHW